jgi:hypothetical protein
MNGRWHKILKHLTNFTGYMKNSIWIIDDDSDDHELIRDILEELDVNKEVKFFHTAK